MPVYNFKSITVVPSGKDLIDIVLSKTQRKTPTVIHKQYAIPRIRHFYIRKVKTCQQFFHDKLNDIITQFPSVENIHPFYADLINVLYSKDHYKLALGQINTAKNIIDGIGRDQVKLLKYGESLYQCKTLKRTAFGRMCTVVKRQNDNLKFLEETRQHLSRLPSIDTESRTLILCGFPNVGKSSFINKVTRADVEVQPFPFTTKSIYVGHTDYNNLRWQVIDTPGLLDRPLDQHNTIEMISITALAHLQAAIVFIIDLSEQCGYSLEKQLSLYKNLRPLFADKPLLGVINKCEVRSLSSASEEYINLLKEHFRLPGEEGESDKPQLLEMSTLTEVGVVEVRNVVCGDLLMLRVQKKLNALKTAAMDEDSSLARRIFIAQPDSNELRKPHIPEGALKIKAEREARKRILREDEAENVCDEVEAMVVDDGEKKYKTLREKELAEGDEYETDLRVHWDIKNPSEKYDVIPFIFNGHNILDYFDEDIEKRLDALEKEEQEREASGFYEEHDWHKDDAIDDNNPEFQKTRSTAAKIREAKAIRILEMRETKHAQRKVVPRSKKYVDADKARKDLENYGLPCDLTEEEERGRSRRKRAVERGQKPDAYHEAVVARTKVSRSRSGVRDDLMEKKVIKLGLKNQRSISRNAKKGEADRTVPNLKPKHLFSGKRTIGKNDRR